MSFFEKGVITYHFPFTRISAGISQRSAKACRSRPDKPWRPWNLVSCKAWWSLRSTFRWTTVDNVSPPRWDGEGWGNIGVLTNWYSTGIWWKRHLGWLSKTAEFVEYLPVPLELVHESCVSTVPPRVAGPWRTYHVMDSCWWLDKWMHHETIIHIIIIIFMANKRAGYHRALCWTIMLGP